MRWADVVAAQSLVQQVPTLSEATYISNVPRAADGTPLIALPYAILHPIGGTPTAGRETGPAVTEHPSFTLHLVGVNAENALALTDLLRPLLTPETIPVVDGRRNTRIWWREPLPLQEDTDVKPPLIFAIVEFGWRSDPA